MFSDLSKELCPSSKTKVDAWKKECLSTQWDANHSPRTDEKVLCILEQIAYIPSQQQLLSVKTFPLSEGFLVCLFLRNSC